jgi:hypothetical protein
LHAVDGQTDLPEEHVLGATEADAPARPASPRCLRRVDNRRWPVPGDGSCQPNSEDRAQIVLSFLEVWFDGRNYAKTFITSRFSIDRDIVALYA